MYRWINREGVEGLTCSGRNVQNWFSDKHTEHIYIYLKYTNGFYLGFCLSECLKNIIEINNMDELRKKAYTLILYRKGKMKRFNIKGVLQCSTDIVFAIDNS